MKTLAHGVFLVLVLLADPARADYFQVFDGPRYVPYAKVFVLGRLYGYTDAFGRIKIEEQSGPYSGEVEVRGVRKRINFTVDGARQLKRLNV